VQTFDRVLGSVRRSAVMRRTVLLRVPPRDRFVDVLGASEVIPQLQSTVFREGRWFSAREARDGRPVAVLGRALVDSVYRGVVPRRLRLSRVVFDVIGVAESGALAPVTIDRSIVVPAGLLNRLALAEGGAPAILAQVSENPRIAGVHESWRILERRHPRFTGRLSMVSSSQWLGDASRLSAALRTGASGLSAVLVAASLAAVAALMMTIARGHAHSVGVTRAMGATRAQVVLQGLLIGIMVGAVGVCSGTAMGVVTAQFVPVLFDLPAITTNALLVAVARAGALPLITAAGASAACFARLSVRAPADLLA
jgi:putative ABC transport system permease protein